MLALIRKAKNNGIGCIYDIGSKGSPINTALPDCFVQIRDDEKAKAFLLSLGILGDLAKDITLYPDEARGNDNTILVAF